MGPSGDSAKDLAIQEQTETDVGVASPVPRTRHEMDVRWGEGAWRPCRRFVIFQHRCQKWRAIVDGSIALHNDAISAAPRVHTAEPAWAAAVSRRFWHKRSVLPQKLAGSPPLFTCKVAATTRIPPAGGRGFTLKTSALM